MKAEETLKENLIGVNQTRLESHHDFKPSVIKAMQEYAKQKCREQRLMITESRYRKDRNCFISDIPYPNFD